MFIVLGLIVFQKYFKWLELFVFVILLVCVLCDIGVFSVVENIRGFFGRYGFRFCSRDLDLDIVFFFRLF